MNSDMVVMEGTVRQVIYPGSTFRYELEVEEMSIFIDHPASFPINEKVWLVIPRNRFYIYPDEPTD